MKIAIGKSNRNPVPEGWIDYCVDNSLEYKFVDPYSSDVISEVKDCDIFLWYIYHTDYRDMLFAKQLIISLELAGVKVFPDYYTCWNFDDKLGQKYALEAVDAPHIPTYVFYTQDEAKKWAYTTDFPKIFKLRGGAGGKNVLFVKNKKIALKLIDRSFCKGIPQTASKIQYLKEQLRLFHYGKRSLLESLMKGVGIFLVKPEYDRMHGREKGYVMFQDFVPGNKYDIRLIVIGNRAYGMKREVRKNDFRASGSGNFIYSELPEEVIKIGFKTAADLNLQSVAFDFLYLDGKPVIIEMCYGFGTSGSSKCTGYWDRSLNWHEKKPNPNYWELEDLIKSL